MMGCRAAKSLLRKTLKARYMPPVYHPMSLVLYSIYKDDCRKQVNIYNVYSAMSLLLVAGTFEKEYHGKQRNSEIETLRSQAMLYSKYHCVSLPRYCQTRPFWAQSRFGPIACNSLWFQVHTIIKPRV